MKNALFITLVCSLLPLVGQSQSKTKRGTSILAATSFNYYPSLKPYKFVSRYFEKNNDLLLTFLTNNSGTFVLMEGDSALLERELSSQIPSQLVGVGASVQFKKLNGLFHEISLTKLSFIKSSRSLIHSFEDNSGKLFFRNLGYDEKMFAFGLRYEFGKYFGRQKDAKLRFGISGGIEPSFYRYARLPKNSADYPLNGKLLTIDLALIPMLSASLSKKMILDFKLVPNFLIADFGTIREENPALAIRQQGGLRNYKSPDMTWAFSVQLRYMVKEAKRKKNE